MRNSIAALLLLTAAASAQYANQGYVDLAFPQRQFQVTVDQGTSPVWRWNILDNGLPYTNLPPGTTATWALFPSWASTSGVFATSTETGASYVTIPLAPGQTASNGTWASQVILNDSNGVPWFTGRGQVLVRESPGTTASLDVFTTAIIISNFTWLGKFPIEAMPDGLLQSETNGISGGGSAYILWTGAEDGDVENPNNWEGGVVPGPADTAWVTDAFGAANMPNTGELSASLVVSGSEQAQWWAALHGSAHFWGATINFGTVRGPVVFHDASLNYDGVVVGSFVFAGSSRNMAGSSIQGSGTFIDSASNEGTVNGTVTFADTSQNPGEVIGNAVFVDSAYNVFGGSISGHATFIDATYNLGTVGGTITYLDTQIVDMNGMKLLDGGGNGGQIDLANRSVTAGDPSTAVWGWDSDGIRLFGTTWSGIHWPNIGMFPYIIATSDSETSIRMGNVDNITLNARLIVQDDVRLNGQLLNSDGAAIINLTPTMEAINDASGGKIIHLVADEAWIGNGTKWLDIRNTQFEDGSENILLQLSGAPKIYDGAGNILFDADPYGAYIGSSGGPFISLKEGEQSIAYGGGESTLFLDLTNEQEAINDTTGAKLIDLNTRSYQGSGRILLEASSSATGLEAGDPIGWAASVDPDGAFASETYTVPAYLDGRTIEVQVCTSFLGTMGDSSVILELKKNNGSLSPPFKVMDFSNDDFYWGSRRISVATGDALTVEFFGIHGTDTEVSCDTELFWQIVE
jgi:hypothetical protein